MRSRTLSVTLLLAATAGCGSSGLSPHEDQSQSLTSAVYQLPPDTRPQRVVPTPVETAMPAATRPAALTVAVPPNIVLPMRVGVVQVGEGAPPQSALDAFRAHPELFNVVEPLAGNFDRWSCDSAGRPKTTFGVAELSRVRALAAEMGLNYVLVYGGTIDQTSTPTPLKIFDLTIIGCFVIPSEHLVGNGKAVGSMVDVATGRVVLNVSVDARGATYLPTLSAQHAGEAMAAGLRDELVTK